jgi:4-amino-4-deoxy-L-arabinose transferase-like glycosyltransferase
MSEQDRRAAPDAVEDTNQRAIVTVLLIGGLLLVVLTQQVLGPLTGLRRALATGLLALGLASFALAVISMAHLGLRSRLAAAAGRAAAFFGLRGGQLLLLLYGPCFALLAGLAAGESLQALNFWIAIIAYLLALGASLAGAFRAGPETAGGLDRWDLLALLAFCGLALFLRLIDLEHLPTTLSGDEGSVGLQAVSFIQGKANNPFTVGWFSFPSLFYAVQGGGIRLLGQTAAGVRFMSVLAGALSVGGLYWLARITFGRLVAIMAALVLATWHYHIHFSRLAVNNIWDGFFAVLTLAGLAYGWKYGRRLGFIVAGLALGLGQYFYVSFRAMPLLLLLWAILALVFQRKRLRLLLPDLLLGALVALVVTLPLQLYFAGHVDEFLAPMRRVTVFDGWLAQMAEVEGRSQLWILARQMAYAAAGITHLPLRHWYNPGAPLLLAGPAGLFLLGLLWLLLRPRLLHLLVLLPIAAVVILGGFSQDAPASQRYVLAAPLIAIVVALPLAEAARWLWLAWPRFRPAIALALVLALAWLAWSNVHYYFYEVYDEYVLGGGNTEVATAIARYLQEQEPPVRVYFFGLPRMGYYSLATVAYLAPQVTAEDVIEPLQGAPDWQLEEPTIFLFLPEREAEMAYVEDRYPGGVTGAVDDGQGVPLFLLYAVTMAAPAGQ